MKEYYETMIKCQRCFKEGIVDITKIVKYAKEQGRAKNETDIKTARRCLIHTKVRNPDKISCCNSSCLNESCPLHRRWK